jgi:CheY-like chemotaxis protein
LDKAEIPNTKTFNMHKNEFKGRLLVVDDSEENRMILKHFLKDTHFEIEEASSGEVALFKVKETKYDLIFMDMNMPHMDGFEATQRIRILDKSVKIVALSAYSMAHEIQKMHDAGCEATLSKPLTKRKLLEFLDENLR